MPPGGASQVPLVPESLRVDVLPAQLPLCALPPQVAESLGILELLRTRAACRSGGPGRAEPEDASQQKRANEVGAVRGAG